MASTKRMRKAPTKAKRSGRPRKSLPREARATYAELQQGVRHLENAMSEIQRGLLKAERRVEAEARARIRAMRKDARAQLNVLRSKQRDVASTLKRVSAAASGSWKDITRSVDTGLADAKATASAVVARFRRALAS